MDGLVSIVNRNVLDSAETVVPVITSPINVTGYVLLGNSAFGKSDIYNIYVLYYFSENELVSI